MILVNTDPKDTVRVDSHQLRFTVKPGEECDVAPEYCRARFTGAGARVPSAIEQLAPQLKPTRPQDERIYAGSPDEHVPMTPRGNGPRNATDRHVPPGVAEILEQQKQAAIDASLKKGK